MSGIVLPLCKAGTSNQYLVPDGAPSKSIDVERDGVSSKYSYLRDILPLIEDCKEIILCTDADTDGQVLRDDLAVRLGKTRCKFVTYLRGARI